MTWVPLPEGMHVGPAAGPGIPEGTAAMASLACLLDDSPILSQRKPYLRTPIEESIFLEVGHSLMSSPAVLHLHMSIADTWMWGILAPTPSDRALYIRHPWRSLDVYVFLREGKEGGEGEWLLSVRISFQLEILAWQQIRSWHFMERAGSALSI